MGKVARRDPGASDEVLDIIGPYPSDAPAELGPGRGDDEIGGQVAGGHQRSDRGGGQAQAFRDLFDGEPLSVRRFDHREGF